MRGIGISIGAHPGFLRTHGDRVRAHYSPNELVDYQPLRSWLSAGIPLFGGTDAPYSEWSPWRAMQTAVDRTTASGVVLGAEESLTPEAAFAMFTREGAHREQAPVPTIHEGDAPNFLILDRPWHRARSALGDVTIVAAVWRGNFIDMRA